MPRAWPSCCARLARLAPAGRDADRHRAPVGPARRRAGRGRPSGRADPSQRGQGLPAALPRRRRQERSRRRLSCSPTSCAPTAIASARSRPLATTSRRCAPWSAAATISSPSASRSPTSCAPARQLLARRRRHLRRRRLARSRSPSCSATRRRQRRAPRREAPGRPSSPSTRLLRPPPARRVARPPARRPDGLAGEAEAEAKGELVRALAAVLERPRRPRSPSSPPASSTPSPTCRTARSSCPSRAPAASAPRRSSPSSATSASASRPNDQLAAEAGVCPVTHASGKRRGVVFRWACNHRLRRAVTCFADNSRHASAWAADVYQRARSPRLRSPARHPHPRPRLDPHPLARLERPHKIRSSQTPSRPRSDKSGMRLTQRVSRLLEHRTAVAELIAQKPDLTLHEIRGG